MLAIQCTTALLLAIVAPAAAGAADPLVPDRDNGFYYNRPGATTAQADADHAACVALTAGTSARVYAGNGLAGALVGGIAAGLATGRERERNVETCMMVKGWRQVVLTAAQWQALKAALVKDRAGTLEPLTGAEPVALGVVGAAWTNDYAQPKPLAEAPR